VNSKYLQINCAAQCRRQGHEINCAAQCRRQSHDSRNKLRCTLSPPESRAKLRCTLSPPESRAKLRCTLSPYGHVSWAVVLAVVLLVCRVFPSDYKCIRENEQDNCPVVLQTTNAAGKSSRTTGQLSCSFAGQLGSCPARLIFPDAFVVRWRKFPQEPLVVGSRTRRV